MINKVILIGNAGKDVETRTLESGVKVCTFSLATTESYKDKNDEWQNLTEWHNISVWKPSAKIESLTKGTAVYLEGKIKSRKYTDKDGIERVAYEIVANVVRSLAPKQDRQNDVSVPETNDNWSSPMDMPKNDLPF
jgi:single-strand DNA-binding protein